MIVLNGMPSLGGFLTEEPIFSSGWPHSSSSLPRSVQPRVQEARSPAAPDSGSPWSLSPHALFWTCSSTGSLTYSNIHSVTRGHRSKETIGILSCLNTGFKRQNKHSTPSLRGSLLSVFSCIGGCFIVAPYSTTFSPKHPLYDTFYFST